MVALGCLGIIIIWLLAGVLEGAVIYALWNWVIAAMLSLPHIPWTWAFGIGLMLALFTSSSHKN